MARSHHNNSSHEIIFEEALSDEWSQDLGVIEVPLDEQPLWYLGLIAGLLGLVIAGRLLFLGLGKSTFYEARAESNLFQFERVSAPRGPIVDRFGDVLAENQPVFSALLDLRMFLRERDLEEKTFALASSTLGIARDALWAMIEERNVEQSGDPILLSGELSQRELVALKAADLDTIKVVDSFKRIYPNGPLTASLIGYLGLPTAGDLKSDGALSGQDMIGKAGIEAFYDKELRGKPGLSAKLRNASGKILGAEKRTEPKIGATLALTIDTEFQRYFYDRFMQSLHTLGRTSGVGIAIDPRNGEVLALMNFPSYDNNVFHTAGENQKRIELLTSPQKPLFNRSLAGLYNPGSTIKPLDGVAALAEGVIDPEHTIYSPGYLDVPNPYDAEHPSRFVDWRFQGNVDLGAALAQSSNVYFYIVGGGSPQRDPRLGVEWNGDFGVKGLGISRLIDWWKKFRLDEPTGIDMLGEASGFLPTPEWKKEKTDRSWLLGDTYNVSIGQGDLSVTPIELLNYITAIANGGTLYQPFLNTDRASSTVLSDLTWYAPEIKEVQKGMRQAVTGVMGTAHTLNDLPFTIGAKTGSAQVQNNTQENAFFVGYAPYNDPQIAILILVENSKEGSLNAVPIAKDVLSWYYEHRIKNSHE